MKIKIHTLLADWLWVSVLIHQEFSNIYYLLYMTSYTHIYAYNLINILYINIVIMYIMFRIL